MATTTPPVTNQTPFRLRAIPPSELPAHPSLSALQTASPPDLRVFILGALTAGRSLAVTTLATDFVTKGAPKSSPPSAASVQLLAGDTASKTSPLARDDVWFARRSVHEDVRSDGSASWDEFVEGLFNDHSIHEGEYTPDIFDAHKVLDWSAEIAGIDAGEWAEWKDIGMEVYEMCHQLPGPLENRVFATLVVKGKPNNNSFVVAQFPVELSKVDVALYSNGRHRKEGDSDLKKANCVIGQYTSVERCEKRADDGKVLWDMATASDAKGNLPMMMQKMGVPGAIAKDVGFFMQWAQERR